jgi:hypothetical protein
LQETRGKEEKMTKAQNGIDPHSGIETRGKIKAQEAKMDYPVM